MKKLKVTRRPSAKNELILQPSRLRMFFIYIILFALALGFGLVIRLLVNRGGFSLEWLNQNWPAGLGITIVGAGLLSLIERSRWTLRVRERQGLEGPTGAFGERVTIPLDEIDWQRTRRSLSSRLKIGNAIYGRNRSRILINQWFFTPEDLHTLIRAIGGETKLA